MKLKVIKSLDIVEDRRKIDVQDILGGNKYINKSYSKGFLDTLILTKDPKGLDCTYSLGKEYRKPIKLINFYREICKCSSLKTDLSYLDISYDGDLILVSYSCGGSETTLFFNNTKDGLKLSEDSFHHISNSNYIIDIEKKLLSLVEWLTEIIPYPLYGIKYFIAKENSSSYNVSSGKFYMGFCESTSMYGSTYKDCIGVKGEYVAVFLEICGD